MILQIFRRVCRHLTEQQKFCRNVWVINLQIQINGISNYDKKEMQTN